MSNEFEDEDEGPVEAVQWMQSDSIELDELCAGYREHHAKQKLYESLAKEEEAKAKNVAGQIQARMGEHKRVRTSAGYTVAWVPFTRKGYTVADASGERWQLRSPF